MSRIAQVGDEFRADVGRAIHLLQLIKTFREFGGSEAGAEVAATESWPEALRLWEASKQRRTDLPWLSGSLLLYLAGRFEYFARHLVETIAEDLTDGVDEYDKLPHALRAELRVRTLEIARNPHRYGYTEGEATAFLVNLVENVRGTSPCTISAAVISVTEVNLKERPFADLLKRVGIEDFWREAGKQAPLKIHLELADERRATAEAQQRLNALMDERNQIAHPTNTTSFPDPDQVLRTAEFLVVLAGVAIDVANVQLLNLKASAAGVA